MSVIWPTLQSGNAAVLGGQGPISDDTPRLRDVAARALSSHRSEIVLTPYRSCASRSCCTSTTTVIPHKIAASPPSAFDRRHRALAGDWLAGRPTYSQDSRESRILHPKTACSGWFRRRDGGASAISDVHRIACASAA